MSNESSPRQEHWSATPSRAQTLTAPYCGACVDPRVEAAAKAKAAENWQAIPRMRCASTRLTDDKDLPRRGRRQTSHRAGQTIALPGKTWRRLPPLKTPRCKYWKQEPMEKSHSRTLPRSRRLADKK